MNYKKRAIFALCAAVIAAILPALLLVVYVDPFQIYHKPFISGMALQKNQRYQNAGLINSYLADPKEGHDSVIIGTSMSQNFTGAMVTKTLGWKKPLRLAMPGALAEEQLAVLQHALDTGNVRHVLLEMHPFLYQNAYRPKKLTEEDRELYFPEFLYNDTFWDDGAYVFNINVLKLAWKNLFRRFAKNKNTGEYVNRENIGYWGDTENVSTDHADFNSPANIEKLKSETAGFSLKPKTDDEVAAFSYPRLTENLMPILNQYCNSNIEIIMYVPPWPRFRYQKSEKVSSRSIYMLRHILRNIDSCSNISLYDFDLLEFPGDMNNYKDIQHYLPVKNQEILDRISRQQNRLMLADVRAFETRFIDMINHYTVYTSYKN